MLPTITVLVHTQISQRLPSDSFAHNRSCLGRDKLKSETKNIFLKCTFALSLQTKALSNRLHLEMCVYVCMLACTYLSTCMDLSIVSKGKHFLLSGVLGCRCLKYFQNSGFTNNILCQ